MISYNFFCTPVHDDAPIPNGGIPRVTRSGEKWVGSVPRPYVPIDQLDLPQTAAEFAVFAEIAGDPEHYSELGIEFLLVYDSIDELFGLCLDSEFVATVSPWKPAISFAVAPNLAI